MNTSELWTIGLDAWIVQDGNYPDFRAGKLAEFAVEHVPSHIAVTQGRSKLARRVEGADYDLVGEVVYASREAWVLDCGLLVFNEGTHRLCRVGEWLTMRASIGVDPFFYFERLYALKGMPPLIYTWRVERISRNIAPVVRECNEAGQETMGRDASKRSYVDVIETDAWTDDEGFADYLLHCTRLDSLPKRQSGTAGYP